MANATINQGMYRAASSLGMTIGDPAASWTIATPAVGLGGTPTSGGTIAGYALQGRIGQQGTAAPGSQVEPIKWYFVPTTGTLAAGQRITYSGSTFVIVGLASQMGHYEIERA